MLELTVRLVASLAIVVGLLILLARFGARKFRGTSGAMVHVVHRQPLSRTSSIAVVTVGTRVLVLGTTEQQVSVLAELEPDELDLDSDLGDVSDLITLAEVAPTLQAPTLTLATEAVQEPQPRPRGSHRAAPAPRTTRAARPATTPGGLAGSVLSPQTWRQALSAVRRAS